MPCKPSYHKLIPPVDGYLEFVTTAKSRGALAIPKPIGETVAVMTLRFSGKDKVKHTVREDGIKQLEYLKIATLEILTNESSGVKDDALMAIVESIIESNRGIDSVTELRTKVREKTTFRDSDLAKVIEQLTEDGRTAGTKPKRFIWVGNDRDA